MESQKEDAGDCLMWQTCKYHPLAVFLPEAYEEGHESEVLELTREGVVAEMAGYMPFAIGKAENQRGISASRSIWKYEQWLWVLEDPLKDTIAYYDDYGMSHLKTIAEKYKLPLEEAEDDNPS